MTPATPPTRGDLELLGNEIANLTGAYKTSRKRLIISYVVIALLAVLVVGTVVLTIISINASSDAKNAAAVSLRATGDAKKAQVVSCQNANETRAGQRQWIDFQLDTSKGTGGPELDQAIELIRTWTHDLFANRDCSDLTKKYEIPTPPDVQKLLEAARENAEN